SLECHDLVCVDACCSQRPSPHGRGDEAVSRPRPANLHVCPRLLQRGLRVDELAARVPAHTKVDRQGMTRLAVTDTGQRPGSATVVSESIKRINLRRAQWFGTMIDLRASEVLGEMAAGVGR